MVGEGNAFTHHQHLYREPSPQTCYYIVAIALQAAAMATIAPQVIRTAIVWASRYGISNRDARCFTEMTRSCCIIASLYTYS